MGASVDYLEQDRRTGLLSYRRVYPVELRPYVPRQTRELKRSLKSTDIRAPGAMERFRAAASEYDRIVSLARKEAAGYGSGASEGAEIDKLTYPKLNLSAVLPWSPT